MNKNLLIIAAAAAAYLIWKGGNVINNLSYRINSTKFDKFSINEIIIKSNITLFNRSKSQLTLNNFVGTLFYKNLPASQINANINKIVEPSGKTDIDIYFNIDPLNFFNQLSILLSSGDTFGNFKVTGNLNTPSFDIPINYTPDILPN